MLDIFVYGRRAARRALEVNRDYGGSEKLTVEHIRDYHASLQELAVPKEQHSPVLLPDYTPAKQKAEV